jgi:hypothetical protein
MAREDIELSYAEAPKAVENARARVVVLLSQPRNGLLVDAITQIRITTVVAAMLAVGRLPGDFPPTKFDESITYHRLTGESLQWLHKCGIPACRAFAPLAAKDYSWLFGTSDRLPVPEEDAGRFFSRLIHCLLIETQLLIAKQYYHGLGLYKKDVSISVLSEVLPPEVKEGLLLRNLRRIEFDQLHGRIFLEYCAVMIRAQWDKLSRLVCLVLGLKWNWDTVSDGLRAIEQELGRESKPLHPWCSHHILIFLNIAKERLAEDGWLKGFRDPLLHDVGQHSAGVVPHKKSLETTSEMWDRIREEHNWLREAMMAMLVSFTSMKAKVEESAS